VDTTRLGDHSSTPKTSRSPRLRGAPRPAPPLAPRPGCGPLTAEGLLGLQRTAGNQATLRYLARARQTLDPAEPAVQRVDWSMASPKELSDAYQAACRKNDTERARLVGYIAEGAGQRGDLRLRNSCEWVLQGRGKAYALTGTHDAVDKDARVGKVRYFPYNKINAADASIYGTNPYYVDPTASGIYFNTTVTWRNRDDMGFRQGSDIAIVMENPVSGVRKTKADTFITLKHEVQHMADRHPEGDDLLAAAIETYRTEYRAYSLMGDAKYDQWPTDGGELEGGPDALRTLGYFWPNPRQHVILGQLYLEYPEVKRAWDDENDPALKPSQRPFHRAVREFTVPVSLNRDNSIRVDNFYRALDGLAPTTKPTDPAVSTLVGTFLGESGDSRLEKLTSDDAAAILAGPLETEYKAKLAPAVWSLIFKKLNEVAPVSVKTLWNRWF
jgi:hypothetical protein